MGLARANRPFVSIFLYLSPLLFVAHLSEGSYHKPDSEDDLQHWLDSMCESYLKERCEKVPEDPECQKMTGENQQYRCYYTDTSEGAPGGGTGTCVDTCGKKLPCGDHKLRTEITVSAETMREWTERGRQMFCPPYQDALQRLCDKTDPESVVRYSTVFMGSFYTPAFICLPKTMATYGEIGFCLDNCGRLARCHGNTPNLKVDSNDVTMLDFRDVKESFNAVPPPCPRLELCVSTSRNPPVCEDDAREEKELEDRS